MKWLFSLKEPKSRIARWIELLSAFDFDIEYRPGTKHGNADGMSRCPVPRDCQCPETEKKTLACGPCKKCLKRSEDMKSSLTASQDNEPCARQTRKLGSPYKHVNTERLYGQCMLNALLLAFALLTGIGMCSAAVFDGTLFPIFVRIPKDSETESQTNPLTEGRHPDDGRTRPKLNFIAPWSRCGNTVWLAIPFHTQHEKCRRVETRGSTRARLVNTTQTFLTPEPRDS